jgi:hypothetical protein|tara:strand:+ start:138 stop:311 length:174 start_codon:yes stop_codon:yes gene_type:complete
MYDKTFEEFVAELNELEAAQKARYKNYCEQCEGTPVSYDEWLHTDVFNDHLIDELPF